MKKSFRVGDKVSCTDNKYLKFFFHDSIDVVTEILDNGDLRLDRLSFTSFPSNVFELVEGETNA
jgi:hypothetical protein